ncbi:hypothetical protein N7520_005060 [Penicillium odoratum]|uniref:uncharacterized protein n=1 Tax=Penicillium odoratum TaxID=1167516 RepID=UPI002549BC32|nr:uncharacterized protein N7520_005060 [Penicillium odoratum]KAJ5765501.1 hypothetical protein N7520_005060 [Penicillium odoratum]
MTAQLKAHIDEIGNCSLSDTIQAIADLLPGLTGYVSPTCQYVITHQDYSGDAPLNDLGGIFLKCAKRCTNENASFQTRLLHHSLEKPIEELFINLYNFAKAGIEIGLIKREPLDEEQAAVCACCRGDPDAVILLGFHQGKAFYYMEKEFRDNWGDAAESAWSTSWNEETDEPVHRLMASKAQVEEALARTDVVVARL